MSSRNAPTRRRGSADRCDEFTYDAAKVARVRPRLAAAAEVVPLFKALADETRAQIVYALTQEEELCVCEVATLIGCSVAAASHHLRLLRSLRLAKPRRQGKMVFYSLEDDHVRQLLELALTHRRERRPEDQAPQGQAPAREDLRACSYG